MTNIRSIRSCPVPLALALLLLAFASQRVAVGATQGAPDYWLSGVDPVVQKDRNKNDPADYMELFRPSSPWASSAAKLKGFKISTQMAFRGTDEQLNAIIDGLKARHIGLSVELGLLVYADAPPSCGQGSEGIGREPGPGRPSAAERVAKRLTALGGTLDYVELDEPVTWGHSRTGLTRAGYPFCHKPIDALVDEMAPQVATLRQYFPNIQLGLVDAINGRWPDLPQGILSLIDTMNRRLNVKIPFVHTDVAWDSDWRPGLQVLAQGLRERGVRFGIICDGDVKSPSDEAWTTQAVGRCSDVNRDPKTKLDDFMVQSWVAQPTRMLPETMPGTSTWTLKQVEALH
jgi:hypothetical protein